MTVRAIAAAASIAWAQAWAAGSAVAQAKQGAGTFLVRAKRVHLEPGRTIENAAVLVKDGKIAAIGPDLTAPAEAVTIAGEEMTAGLIEANSTAGQRFAGVEEASEITGDFRALANLDWTSPEFERLVRAGITTVFVAPSNRNVVGGVASIVKTAPAGNPRTVRAEAAVKVAFGNTPAFGNFTPRGFGLPQSFRVRRPGSRPGTVMEMRMAFDRARRCVGKLGIVPADIAPLVDALESRLPLRAHAWDLMEIRSALRVGAEFGVKMTIDGGGEAHRCIGELKAAGAKLVIGPHSAQPTFGLDGRGRNVDFGDRAPAQDLLARVAAAGIPVALSADRAPRADDLAAQMRIAVRYGASREAALRAVTSGAADVLGIGGDAGVLAVGRDADLVLWSGSPFEFTSKPTLVMVDGVAVVR